MSGPRALSALRIVGTVLSALLLGIVAAAAAALIVVPKATGSMPLTVLTGSMSPTYEPGSVVVVRPTPADELRIGDPITYQVRSDDPEVVTHRIVSMVYTGEGDRQFLTRGDANGGADVRPVEEGQIRGKVWYSVPYVGHALTGLSPDIRELALKALAIGLIMYGAVLVGAGAMQRDAGARREAPRHRRVAAA